MIIKFSDSVFDSDQDAVLLKLLKIILSYFDGRFFWDIDNIYALFADDNGDFSFKNKFSSDFITDSILKILENKIGEAIQASAYNTALHKKYLKTITVGFKAGEIHPKKALDLISKESLLIVENSTNDGAFLKGLIHNYSNYGKYKSIFSLVKKAFDDNLIVPYHAGGTGGFRVILDDLQKGSYAEIIHDKVIVIFDSDRDNSSAMNTKHTNLLTHLKGRQFDTSNPSEWVYQNQDVFFWRMSYKRELENYTPLSLILDSYSEINDQTSLKLKNSSDEEQDFFKFGSILNSGFKNSCPQIFLKSGIAMMLEEKCKHHKSKIELPNGTLDDVSEHENMLLMIAKLI